MSPFTPLLTPLISAGLLAAAMVGATWLTRRTSEASIAWGRRLGAISHVSDRSSHTEPTSRLGGVGLVLGFLIPAAVFTGAIAILPRNELSWGFNPALLGWLALGAAAMFAIGLADDVFNLPPLMKMGGQAAALLPLVASGLRWLNVESLIVPGVPPMVLSTGLALLWVLFFVNAFNFMDGMDGFAVRFALSAIFWLFIAVPAVVVAGAMRGADPGTAGLLPLLGLRLEFLLLAVLSAACSGFYGVNRAPARVFMGDAGSLTLGYLLAIQVMLADGGYYASQPGPSEAGRMVTGGSVMILLLPFTFDVVLTLVRRARRGENLLRAHRSHLYQRLMIAGMGHREVLRLNVRYFRVCGGLAVLYAVTAPALWRASIAAAAMGAMAHYWLYVVRREREAGAAGAAAEASD